MRTTLFFFLLLYYNTSIAGKVSGIVTDNLARPLSFSSIIVKGTAQGTSANMSGKYSLLLSPGEYTLICQHVGYKSSEKKNKHI